MYRLNTIEYTVYSVTTSFIRLPLYLSAYRSRSLWQGVGVVRCSRTPPARHAQRTGTATRTPLTRSLPRRRRHLSRSLARALLTHQRRPLTLTLALQQQQ
mgnify:CR=1 FL=1